MNNEELVRSLVADLAPVRRLRSVDSRAARWAALALSCACLGSYALGARSDLARKLHDPAFLTEGAALLVVFLAAARAAFRLGIPGAEPGPLARAVPIVGLFAWVLLLASRWSPGASDPIFGPGAWGAWRDGLPCVGRMLGLAFAPAIAIVFLLREAAPGERRWTGLFAFLSSSAVAILGTQMVCMKDAPRHLLLWHVGPVLIAALVGAGAGKWFLTCTRDRGVAGHAAAGSER